MARGPIRYLPCTPEMYQRHLRQLVETSGLSIEELAARIQKTPEWIRQVLADPEYGRDTFEDALVRCIEENFPHYTSAEIEILLREKT